MKKIFISTLNVLMLVACTESGDAGGNAPSLVGSFPPLPTSSVESVSLSGNMVFWMHEGDGGCFGTITDGSEEVQLWADIDACGEIEFEDNASASVLVTYRADNQYGPGKTYTVTRFH